MHYNSARMTKPFKNILIIKPSALGDIVQTLPVLTALRRSFPRARITWLVRPAYAAILAGHPDLNETILFDRDYLGKCWYNPRAFAAVVSLCRRICRSRFDAVFDFQGLFRTALFTLATLSRHRFGMACARELAYILYSPKVRQTPECAHVLDYYFKIIKAAGATNFDVEFKLPRDPAAAESVAALLAAENLTPGGYAVLVPSSAWPDKCWPAERFAALARKLALEHDLPVVAVGTASEFGLTERIATLADVPVVNLAGRTSISELVHLIDSARLVVSNDTGPGHIAAALGRPLVMIFGRSNPARVAPYGRKECVVAIDPYGRGLKVNSFDPKHQVDKITFEQVYEKVIEQLTRGSP